MNNKQKKKFGFGDVIIIFLFLAIVGTILYFAVSGTRNAKELSFKEIESLLRQDTDNDGVYDTLNPDTPIKEIEYTGYSGSGFNETLVKISGRFKNGYTYSSFVSIMDRSDFEKIKEYSDYITIKNPTPISNFSWLSLITTILPIVAMVILFVILFRSNSSSNKEAFDFAKSRARLSRKSNVTFKDVAGLDEEKQEVEELVDFLKNPNKYYEMGARIPKGVLLYGDPGTGKTLLARAVAGEANVPFYSISGSDFVEMFVGVGASRVRDMFKVAKQNAPCIVFIDEIDAVGRQRGTGLGGGHDEREQTLNQLLVEMDGFQPNAGIIVMAATNRADVLDPALLRPGRFDRQITISNPDVTAREAILKVHARNKKFTDDVNFGDIAHRTPGFSGADLENLLNEAALLAARDNAKAINTEHIDEAVDRVMMGPAKKSRKYTPEEKRMVAYHEAGHAVIGLKLPHANKVQKITIIPRGNAGGYNLMTPEEETYTQSKTQLLAIITSYLGGRISEEINFNEISTGAYDDIKRSTAIARAMVAEYGMSDLGPIQYETTGGQTFLGRDYLSEKKFSDQVALEIDNEVRKIINECYETGKKIISENRELLDLIANALLELETITKQEIEEILETGKLARLEKKHEEATTESSNESTPSNEATPSKDATPSEDATPSNEATPSEEAEQSEVEDNNSNDETR